MTSAPSSGTGPPASDAEQLTGATALASLLASYGVSTVFAYPGTSELALCAAVESDPRLRLVNARGDKEAAFLAAGACLLRPGSAVSILHGARGLTNALGAIADNRRSETPVLHLVGQASRDSLPHLPPHAEPVLIASAAAFARAAVDCAIIKGFDATTFVQLARRAVVALDELPRGPVVLGLHQDLLEHRFVPPAMLTGQPTRPAAPNAASLVPATKRLAGAKRPVLLVDDYLLLRGEAAETALGRLAHVLQAPVWQVAYRRGAMLFQRLRTGFVPTFRGYYDPADTEHRRSLDKADLLVTVEDRNMYPRVIGRLPACPKIAITSHAEATRKNGYLTTGDVIVDGDPADILDQLAASFPSTTIYSSHHYQQSRTPAREACTSRKMLVAAIGAGLAAGPELVIVDDSQTFGGLFAQHYDLLPEPVRVLGSHGGFVGSGLATAMGAAMASSHTGVVCLVGDQGFTNGVQALAVAGEHSLPVLIILCNNHGSASLRAQAYADHLPAAAASAVTANNSAMSYAAVAHGYGLSASAMSWPGCDEGRNAINDAADRLAATVAGRRQTGTPALLEIITPDGDTDFWRDIWRTAGYEAS